MKPIFINAISHKLIGVQLVEDVVTKEPLCAITIERAENEELEIVVMRKGQLTELMQALSAARMEMGI